FARNPGIEEIGAPVDVDGDVGGLRQRRFEPVLADIAPRADHVGDDVDMHGAWLGGLFGLLRHDAVLRGLGRVLSESWASSLAHVAQWGELAFGDKHGFGDEAAATVTR